MFQHTIIGMPNLFASAKKNSKGGGLVPCIEENILVGPTAREVYDRENYSTDAEDVAQLSAQIAMNAELSKRMLSPITAERGRQTGKKILSLKVPKKLQTSYMRRQSNPPALLRHPQ